MKVQSQITQAAFEAAAFRYRNAHVTLGQRGRIMRESEPPALMPLDEKTLLEAPKPTLR
jgi:hypothetical protein